PVPLTFSAVPAPPPAEIYALSLHFALPILTGIDGLVFAVLVLSVTSLAVTVAVPAVFSVTLNALVPATSAALPGNTAAPSVDVIQRECTRVNSRYVAVSSAITFTLKATPAL